MPGSPDSKLLATSHRWCKHVRCTPPPHLGGSCIMGASSKEEGHEGYRDKDGSKLRLLTSLGPAAPAPTPGGFTPPWPPTLDCERLRGSSNLALLQPSPVLGPVQHTHSTAGLALCPATLRQLWHASQGQAGTCPVHESSTFGANQHSCRTGAGQAAPLAPVHKCRAALPVHGRKICARKGLDFWSTRF